MMPGVQTLTNWAIGARFTLWEALVFVAALIAGSLVFGSCGCSPALTPCSPSDPMGPAMLAECRARIARECVGVPDEECPALHECEAWAQERCERAP